MIDVYVVNVFSLLFLSYFLVGKFVYDQMGLVRVFFVTIWLCMFWASTARLWSIALKIPRPESRVVELPTL